MSQPITISLGVREACSLYYALTQVMNEEEARVSRLRERHEDYEATGEYLTTITTIREYLVADAKGNGIEL